ncbi:MAG: ECF-type sigma factor [Planctomycetota bacterium]
MAARDPNLPDSPTENPDPRSTLLLDGTWVSGEELAPIVYEDLRRIAHSLFRAERPGITIQPTALVHEAYLRLADQKADGWESRRQFLSVAATAMRRVLANAARDRSRLKRGGGAARVTLTGNEPREPEQGIDLLQLEEALESLERVKERYARIVELRYFAGLSIDETAQTLGVSPTIVDREWAKAKAYLALELEDRGPRD